MRRLRLALGLTTGFVAASATAGALIGFGLRFGTPARPFNAISSIVLGARAQGEWAFALVPTVVGVILHIAFSLACGVIYAELVDRLRRDYVAALIVAIAAFFVSTLLATLVGIGLATLLPIGERLALAAVLGLSLPLGMRFALSLSRGEQGTH